MSPPDVAMLSPAGAGAHVKVACAGAHARMQHKQQFAGRPVGAVDGEAPAQPVGFGADLRAVARHQALVIVTPCLGAAGGDGAAPSGSMNSTRPE